MRIFDIPKVSNRFMKSVAQRGIDLIIQDASKGIFQKDSTQYKKFPYSSGYKKYKANSMNRFSDGAKLKGFANQSTDTTTSYKNMRLTGRTLRGMRAGSRKNTGIITYDRGEIVLGNRETDIYNLRTINRNKIMNKVERLYAQKIRKYARKTITIK
jgi:hypothetical protein